MIQSAKQLLTPQKVHSLWKIYSRWLFFFFCWTWFLQIVFLFRKSFSIHHKQACISSIWNQPVFSFSVSKIFSVMALIFLLSSCQKYTCFFQIGAVQNAIFSKPLEHYSGFENMTGDAIQMRTKNLKSRIKIAVNFNIMLSVSDAKIIRGNRCFFDFIKFKFQLEFSRIIFLIFYPFIMIFWPLFLYQKLFWKSFIFIVIQRNFFVKFRLFFWIKGLREISLTSMY